MDYRQWLEYGVDNGFCTDIYCEPHEGAPLTLEEQSEWEEGGDPCCFSVRILGGDAELKESIAKAVGH